MDRCSKAVGRDWGEDHTGSQQRLAATPVPHSKPPEQTPLIVQQGGLVFVEQDLPLPSAQQTSPAATLTQLSPLKETHNLLPAAQVTASPAAAVAENNVTVRETSRQRHLERVVTFMFAAGYLDGGYFGKPSW